MGRPRIHADDYSRHTAYRDRKSEILRVVEEKTRPFVASKGQNITTEGQHNAQVAVLSGSLDLGVGVMEKFVGLNQSAQKLMESGFYSGVQVGIDLPKNRFIMTEMHKDGTDRVSYHPIFDTPESSIHNAMD